MVQGLTRIEGSRGRMDTLIEIFKETRQTDGRLQVYLVREFQKELVEMVKSFGLQKAFKEIFVRIHQSNMTKACSNMEEAQSAAQRIWKLHGTMVRFKSYGNKVILIRQMDGKIMKGPNYVPPYLTDLIGLVGQEGTNILEKLSLIHI